MKVYMMYVVKGYDLINIMRICSSIQTLYHENIPNITQNILIPGN